MKTLDGIIKSVTMYSGSGKLDTKPLTVDLDELEITFTGENGLQLKLRSIPETKIFDQNGKVITLVIFIMNFKVHQKALIEYDNRNLLKINLKG